MSKQITVSTGDKQFVCLKLAELGPATTHVVFQAHVYHGSILSVSLDNSSLPGRNINGTDVGLVSVLRDGDSAKWYLRVESDVSSQVEVVVMAASYTESGMAINRHRHHHYFQHHLHYQHNY